METASSMLLTGMVPDSPTKTFDLAQLSKKVCPAGDLSWEDITPHTEPTTDQTAASV